MESGILVALFVAYAALTTWQMRRATRAAEPEVRMREARKLLGAVTLGVPLLVAVILMLM
jgi:protein-S-isoprenylcysteine O-methyltransferase Ste14